MKGKIYDIQKFAIHDGPGIRTLVFMLGCPLKCVWCSTPQTQKSSPDILYIEVNCKKCGGSGKTACIVCNGKGHQTCKTCNGSGGIQCKYCKGSGFLVYEVTVIDKEEKKKKEELKQDCPECFGEK